MSLAHFPEKKSAQPTVRLAALASQVKGQADYHQEEKNTFHHYCYVLICTVVRRCPSESAAKTQPFAQIDCRRGAHLFAILELARPPCPFLITRRTIQWMEPDA